MITMSSNTYHESSDHQCLPTPCLSDSDCSKIICLATSVTSFFARIISLFTFSSFMTPFLYCSTLHCERKLFITSNLSVSSKFLMSLFNTFLCFYCYTFSQSYSILSLQNPIHILLRAFFGKTCHVVLWLLELLY